MWECGLKLLGRDPKRAEQQVTPYVGVWIETRVGLDCTIRNQVTPYVGVWIETSPDGYLRVRVDVTPYVGVWIETWHAQA